MTKDDVRKRLAGLSVAIPSAYERVKDHLGAFCEDQGYPFIGRIKTIESIAEKIESGRYARWTEVDDLIAFSIIVPSLDHEPGVLEYLQETFKERVLRRRGQANKSPEAFRFDSTRFVGSLKASGAADPADKLYGLIFEIQVRTAFEHAWTVATHSAVYKPESVDWRRLRLAANLKASVEQLDALVAGFDKLSEGLEMSFWPEVNAQAKVVAFVSEMRQSNVIKEVSMPSSLGRLSENFVGLVKKARKPSFGALVDDVKRALDIIQESVKEGEHCPVSLSVFQWMFAVLVREKYIEKLPDRYSIPFGSGVELFPEVSRFNDSVFDWDS